MSEIKLYNGDCLEIMKQIPDKSVDCVISDVPYRIGSRGCSGGTGDVSQKTFYER